MENIGQLTAEETHQNQVTIVVPSNGDATRIMEFTEKVKQVFAARILKTIGSWRETLITFEVDETITAANILNKLVNMPEVERVEEKQIKNQRAMPNGVLVTVIR